MKKKKTNVIKKDSVAIEARARYNAALALLPNVLFTDVLGMDEGWSRGCRVKICESVQSGGLCFNTK